MPEFSYNSQPPIVGNKMTPGKGLAKFFATVLQGIGQQYVRSTFENSRDEKERKKEYNKVLLEQYKDESLPIEQRREAKAKWEQANNKEERVHGIRTGENILPEIGKPKTADNVDPVEDYKKYLETERVKEQIQTERSRQENIQAGTALTKETINYRRQQIKDLKDKVHSNPDLYRLYGAQLKTVSEKLDAAYKKLAANRDRAGNPISKEEEKSIKEDIDKYMNELDTMKQQIGPVGTDSIDGDW